MYEPGFLDIKTWFAGQELAAVSKPFTGLTTSSGKIEGLYPVRATGVSTEPVRKAAEGLLASLRTDQLLRTQFGINDPEWRKWLNVDNGLYVRQGVSLKEMSAPQRAAAMDLMRQSLSVRGFELTESIRKTDQTLKEINNGEGIYDEDLYFFTIMGTPSSTEPWGWQLDGHHLVINYFILGDQVVMSPVFLGGEPAIARTGKYAGNAVLQTEQDKGLALMRNLDPAQQASATLQSRKAEDNIQAQGYKDNLVLDYAGARVSAFTPAQKAELLELIGLFVGNMREGHANIRMEEVTAHIDDTWFAWVGDISDDAVFYYRIHSPVILIEFDHQMPAGTSSINDPSKPTRDHIHVIVRTPNGNDYGKDLLGQHLADHPH